MNKILYVVPFLLLISCVQRIDDKQQESTLPVNTSILTNTNTSVPKVSPSPTASLMTITPQLEPLEEPTSNDFDYTQSKWIFVRNYSEDSDSWDIFQLSLNDETVIPARLSKFDFITSRPLLSPDQQWVAFNAVGIDELEQSAYIMPANCFYSDEGCDALITKLDIPARFRIHEIHDWSPDSNKLLFDFGLQIGYMNIDGSDIVILEDVEGQFPSWSPDGNKIAFSPPTFTNEFPKEWRKFFIYDLLDNELIEISTNTYDAIGPKWSPDGKHITFVSSEGINLLFDREHHYQIYLYDVSTGEVHHLALDLGFGFNQIYWSPWGETNNLIIGSSSVFTILDINGLFIERFDLEYFYDN